jgi:fido (protein-threonine AMPylation protein)
LSEYGTVADKGDWDSYFWPDTQVLRNIPGAHDQDTLNALEMMAAKSRTFELGRGPIDGGFDLEHMQRIHQHLFQDVYKWAGKLRTSLPFLAAWEAKHALQANSQHTDLVPAEPALSEAGGAVVLVTGADGIGRALGVDNGVYGVWSGQV